MNDYKAMRFRNNDLAAHTVYRYIRESQPPIRHLTLRPYNRFDTKFTEWWLIPSTDWPAYRYGKLFFLQSSGARNLMFTGFYIEKGLGRQLTDLTKANQLMGPNWFWNDFLNAARGGVLDAPMRVVHERAGVPLRIYLNLYEFNHVPDPETGINAPDDQLEFVIRDDDLGFTPVVEGKDVLAPLNRAVNLQDLVGHFIGLEKMTWYWVNWMIGVHVQYSTDDTGDWGAADLWHNALEPWLRWVK